LPSGSPSGSKRSGSRWRGQPTILLDPRPTSGWPGIRP